VCLNQCSACAAGTAVNMSDKGEKHAQSGAASPLPAVSPQVTGAAFWEAALRVHPAVHAVAPEPSGSALDAAGSAPPAPRSLCQALALQPQEDALNSLLYALRETSGAGRPTALTQEMAGMHSRTAPAALHALCLRLGAPYRGLKAKRSVLEAAVTEAVESHAGKHPDRAQAALQGTAQFNPPRLFYASLPPAVGSRPASAVHS
jgi:hypothetical protein